MSLLALCFLRDSANLSHASIDVFSFLLFLIFKTFSPSEGIVLMASCLGSYMMCLPALLRLLIKLFLHVLAYVLCVCHLPCDVGFATNMTDDSLLAFHMKEWVTQKLKN